MVILCVCMSLGGCIVYKNVGSTTASATVGKKSICECSCMSLEFQSPKTDHIKGGLSHCVESVTDLHDICLYHPHTGSEVVTIQSHNKVS